MELFLAGPYVFGLLISPEICPNQHFLWVIHLLHVHFKADFRALYFFREFPMYLFKYGNPCKHFAVWNACPDLRSAATKSAANRATTALAKCLPI
jgi:hypothetical protein